MTTHSQDNDIEKNSAMQPSLFPPVPEQEGQVLGWRQRDISDHERDILFHSLLALDQVKGIGFRTMRALFDSGFLLRLPELTSFEISDELAVLIGTGKHQQELIKIVAADKEALLVRGSKLVADLRLQQTHFIPGGHRTYPESLFRLVDPPRWLFVRGSAEVLHSASIIAVVGTRNPTQAGQKLAYACAQNLVKRNIVVLSGLAKGIDQKAHLGATDFAGQTIAVLGHGIAAPEAASGQGLWKDIIDMDGAIVSEYLPEEIPSRTSFLRRNELQVALSKVVIPIECPSLESGTGGTIRRALSIGTPVIGVTVANGDEAALLSTKVNLTKVGIRVFTISSENSGEFWKQLEKLVPDHNWIVDPRPRQERFFRTIEERVLSATKKLDLDEEAIDRLGRSLKSKLLQQ